jgi:hypothetical protein
MKHLKKIFESLDITKEEILENFLYITDKFGDPEINNSSYGKSKKWTISWDIKMNLSVLQEAEQLITKLKDLTEDIDDVLAASDRLEDFTINMSLTNELRLELVPKDTGDNNYQFISHFDSRTLYVRINEIERFFNSKGIRIEKWDNQSSYDEYNQTNDLEIVLNKIDNAITHEFWRLIMAELNNFREDREYQVRTQGKSIVIYPDEEKSYIEVTTK